MLVIPPLIEAITGYELLTGEDLSAFDRGMKGAGAVVCVFSYGNSLVHMSLSVGGITGEKLFAAGVKELASNTVTYMVGYSCDELGLPAPICIVIAATAGGGIDMALDDALLSVLDSPNVYANTFDSIVLNDDGSISALKVGDLNRTVQNYTRDEILDLLDGVTPKSTEIAYKLRNEQIGLNVISDDLFDRYYNMPPEVLGFQKGDQIYVRRSSPTIISDVVHEGTHVIDYVNGMDQNVISSWTGEIRAFREERLFQINSGIPLQFSTEDDMMIHIWANYPR